jgi:DNA-binding transcriptional ArsR family regulator
MDVMLPPEQQEEFAPMQAEICAALAHPQRILMLCALAEHTYHVSGLAEYLGISQPVASRHLRVLREQGLVCASRKGAMVEYRLADERLLDALRVFREVLQERLARRATLLAVASAPEGSSQS